MRTVGSAWEAATAGLRCVYLDDSVLDQMLMGCADVYWEIQALQDQGVDVVRAAALQSATTPDHAVLRQAVQDECGMTSERRELRAVARRPAAVWSVDGTPEQLERHASDAGLDLYRPQIVLRTAERPFTSGEALKRARAIGAIGQQTRVPLDSSSTLLLSSR